MAEIPLQLGAETRDAEDELVCHESVLRRRQQQIVQLESKGGDGSDQER